MKPVRDKPIRFGPQPSFDELIFDDSVKLKIRLEAEIELKRLVEETLRRRDRTARFF